MLDWLRFKDKREFDSELIDKCIFFVYHSAVGNDAFGMLFMNEILYEKIIERVKKDVNHQIIVFCHSRKQT